MEDSRFPLVSMDDVDLSEVAPDFALMHSDFIKVIEEVLKGGNLREVEHYKLLQEKGVAGRRGMVKALMDLWAATSILTGYTKSIEQRLKDEGKQMNEAEIQSLLNHKRLIDENLKFLMKGEMLFIGHTNMVDFTDYIEHKLIEQVEYVKDDLKVTNQDLVEATHEHSELKDTVFRFKREG